MNRQEIFHGLWAITKAKYDECTASVETVGKNHPTERGILQLKAGIYNVAIAAGLALGTDQAMELMSKRFKNLIKGFPSLFDYYRNLPNNEKELMEIALFPEVFMRANFYDTYRRDLSEAEQSEDPQALFKARIKKEVLDEILALWRTFRVKHNLFVFAFDDEVKKDYPVKISNGKVIGDSPFFVLANTLLSHECQRLCDFTASLDKNVIQKKMRIAEYKCAKYRYATVSLIHSTVCSNNTCRKQHNLAYSRYLLGPFAKLLEEHAEYQHQYEETSESEKPDCSLYYAMLVFIDKEVATLQEKLETATDWEKIELQERIGGLKFSKECLKKAWQKRKDVVR